MSYNHSIIKGLDDLDFSRSTYTVTAFSKTPIAVEKNLQNADGSFKGFADVSGPTTANMTIECSTATEEPPAQFSVFPYPSGSGDSWVVLNASQNRSSTAQATFTLALKEAA